MKKIYLTACAFCICYILPAQTAFSVGSSSMEIKPGTAIFINGLIMQPDNTYLISSSQFTNSSDASHYTTQNYVSGTISFNNALPAFSGIIGYYYSDANLNGIAEDQLGIKVHTGQYWRSLSTASRNDVENYVLSNPVSSLVFSELVLADQLVSLPVVWGSVHAVRNNNDVRISWSTRTEQAVSHFQVERSADGRRWSTSGAAVPARNISGEQSYAVTDANVPSHRLYYRIRQEDTDGKFSYSAIISVAAAGESLSATVYPNPVASSFRLTGINVLNIQKVEILDTRGALVESWNKGQSEYDVRQLASGVYHIRIHFINGETQNKQLIKK